MQVLFRFFRYNFIFNNYSSFTIIVYGIQALFGLTIPETQLDSLNVFDKGNNYLVPFSLSNLLSAYLIFAVYFGTSKLSKKHLLFGQ